MNIRVAEYRKHPSLSYSTLKAFLKSPLHGISQEPPKETPAMRFGSAVDCLLKNDHSYVVNPHEDGRTKAAKDFKTQHAGKLILTPQELEKAQGCVEAIRKSKAVQELNLGFLEPDYPLHGEYDGVKLKGLPDYFFASQLIDLKTTSGPVDPTSFARTVDNWHYDLQAALYCELARQNGETLPTFTWIVVESDPPFDVAVYHATDEIFWVGMTKLKLAIGNVKRAQNHEIVGVCEGAQVLTMPTWYGKNL